MTILDRSTGNRIRIDAAQLADELSKRLPDLDKTRDQAASAVHDAAAEARYQIDRAGGIAKVIRADIAHSAEKVVSDNPIDEIGQRIRAVATIGGIRALIARLEKELPDTDRDRYERAYARGRAQARTTYVLAGIAAGVGIGVVGAILLDPKHGKERRETIMRKTSDLTKGAGKAVAAKAKLATDRARGMASQRDVITPSTTTPANESPEPAPLVPVFADGPVTDPASTTWEPLPDSRGQSLPTEMGDTPALPAESAAPIATITVEPVLEAAGDHGIVESNHG